MKITEYIDKNIGWAFIAMFTSLISFAVIIELAIKLNGC